MESEDDVHGGAVGEALEDGAEPKGGKLELVVLEDRVGVDAGDVLGGGPSVVDVLAGHGLLVVGVFLAFNDDLERNRVRTMGREEDEEMNVPS